MVDMRQNADVSDVPRVALELLQLGSADSRHWPKKKLARSAWLGQSLFVTAGFHGWERMRKKAELRKVSRNLRNFSARLLSLLASLSLLSCRLPSPSLNFQGMLIIIMNRYKQYRN
jgi:hypothetical protein